MPYPPEVQRHLDEADRIERGSACTSTHEQRVAEMDALIARARANIARRQAKPEAEPFKERKIK